MNLQRGEIWLADLNPIRGSEQAGIRPVLIFQNDEISKFTTTVLAVPLTTQDCCEGWVLCPRRHFWLLKMRCFLQWGSAKSP